MGSRNTAVARIKYVLKVFLISTMHRTRSIRNVQTLSEPSVDIQDNALITLSVFSQGVEFFDEKLNTLCMAWLIDHGKAGFNFSKELCEVLTKCNLESLKTKFLLSSCINISSFFAQYNLTEYIFSPKYYP